MKKTLIVALVCVNIALLAVLITVNLDQAEAQSVRGERNYMAVTARNASGRDAVWILDMSTRKLAAFRFDPTTKRILVYGGGRSLVSDFGQTR